MNNQQRLKDRIEALRDLVLLRKSQLTERRYPANSSAETIAVLYEELEALKKQGREAVFDLLVSGISHRRFMIFIKELFNE